MPIHLRWAHENTVLRLDFDSSWNWIDYQNVMHLCAREIAARETPVDLLIVPALDANLPPGAFMQFRRSLADAPSNLGKVYIVARHETIFRLMMEAFVHICPELSHNVILVTSPEEATFRPTPLNLRTNESAQPVEYAHCLA